MKFELGHGKVFFKVGEKEVQFDKNELTYLSELDYHCTCNYCVNNRIPNRVKNLCFCGWIALKRWCEYQIDNITDKRKK